MSADFIIQVGNYASFSAHRFRITAGDSVIPGRGTYSRTLTSRLREVFERRTKSSDRGFSVDEFDAISRSVLAAGRP
jgi:hypothetical protein